ncbi:MAG: type III secretion system export apparatus subunit SctR [Rhodocyclaceae bacterium]|nr:type III secretion system export apparatus subunit SctR [Rhodocyclaceae bacterium]
MTNFDPITLAIALALMSLVPVLVICTTSFLKLAIVMSLVRNALGVQQIPPNIALYGLALILSAYIMAPIAGRMVDAVRDDPAALKSVAAMATTLRDGAEPLRAFMVRNSRPEQRDFFVRTAQRMWGAEMAAEVRGTDFLVLAPAFIVTELTMAFQIGFLLFLPFIVIDLIVSNILLAMGMMMVSPVTISLPLKLFLFVSVDGWSRLIHGLILTYA